MGLGPLGPCPLFLFFSACVLLVSANAAHSSAPVELVVHHKHVVLDNGILKLNLTMPEGDVSGITYNAMENLLEAHRDTENRRGYWDLSWGEAAIRSGKFGDNAYHLHCTQFKVILQNENQVEVSFVAKWNSTLKHVPPLDFDKRYVMLRGSSGFYMYGIYEHHNEWPGINIYELRIDFKLSSDKFTYMAIADDRQRFMPVEADRNHARAQVLAFKEAVLLKDPSNHSLKGEVDDKYQYAMDNKDNKVHGWISSDPSVGFWMITPSNEFKTGGPMKQDLTSHTGPNTLSMFVSLHYAGDDLAVKIEKGEHWKKVFGPVFVYLNSNPGKAADKAKLWADAKSQMETQVKNWPYDFPASDDFPKANQRGSLSGKLFVTDRFTNNTDIPAKAAYVGLAPPGEVGSWQVESKGYQFWTTTDESGSFSITNVRTGSYDLYAWVPGFIGDFKRNGTITITPGAAIHLKHLVYEPPRDGPTLWEIGVPDRTAQEFFVPDPRPDLVNKLYVNHPMKYKQYGLWERYADLYPKNDLVYTVGVSDYSKDWFFAHVNRKSCNGPSGSKSYEATTRRIKFNLPNIAPKATYKLRLALASATQPILDLWINTREGECFYTTGRIHVRNNAIARHGIHGMYWLFSVDVPGSVLADGENVFFLTQSKTRGSYQGLMYDYIRLEGPPPLSLDRTPQ